NVRRVGVMAVDGHDPVDLDRVVHEPDEREALRRALGIRRWRVLRDGGLAPLRRGARGRRLRARQRRERAARGGERCAEGTQRWEAPRTHYALAFSLTEVGAFAPAALASMCCQPR